MPYMVVAGNVTVEKVKALAEKWFGDIPAGEKYKRNLPQEPEQTEERKLEVKANVPLDAFYKCWHMPAGLTGDIILSTCLQIFLVAAVHQGCTSHW